MIGRRSLLQGVGFAAVLVSWNIERHVKLFYVLLMSMIGAIVLARRDVLSSDVNTGEAVDQGLIERHLVTAGADSGINDAHGFHRSNSSPGS